MQIDLGKRLREKRREKGLTQEQVAEAVGVSPQAVSRWENSSAYPDVTMLAGLAMYYNSSVDALLGMEELRQAGTLQKTHRRVQEFVTAGRWQDAEKVLRECLRVFPDDEGLLMALGETLAHGDRTEEAIAVGERLLTNPRLSPKTWSSAMVNLIYLYRKAGLWSKAREKVRELPHIWESREIMEAEVAQQRVPGVREALQKALMLLCELIDRADETDVPRRVQLGMDFSANQDTREMLDKLAQFLREN